MLTVERMTDDDWFDKFKPIENKFDNDSSWNNTLFDITEKELNFIQSQKPEKIWTYVDSDIDDSTLIIEGLHYVNRIGYFVTEVPYDQHSIYEIIIE